jgi:hypothetical protein
VDTVLMVVAQTLTVHLIMAVLAVVVQGLLVGLEQTQVLATAAQEHPTLSKPILPKLTVVAAGAALTTVGQRVLAAQVEEGLVPIRPLTLRLAQ